MNKRKFNLFDFLRSCLQLVKIVIVFSMMMLLLYWIQNLTKIFWSWFKPMAGFYDFLLDVANSISSESIMFFNANFEFKYPIALLLLCVLFFVTRVAITVVHKLEELYGDSVRFVKKIEENNFNRKLVTQNVREQKKIQCYQIYIETVVKPKFAHREYNVNLEEQNKILIKHLLEKTGQCSQKYENGFLFTFNSFEQIDLMLDIFTKLFESKAPIDYIICVQIIGVNSRKENLQLKTLIGLKNLNKITTMADTAYRYSFNELSNYEVSQMGVFQKEGGTYEVHQFVPKN